MKLSVLWTIIIFCIALVWGSHIIIIPSSYVTNKSVLTNHMKDVMDNISDLSVEQAHNHLSKARSAASLAKQLISSNVVTSDIKGSSALERYFFDQLAIYPHLSGIYVGGFNGNFFMVGRHTKYQPDGFLTKVVRNDEFGRSVDLTWRGKDYYQVGSEQDHGDTYDPRIRPWFKKVMEHKDVIWTDPYVFFTTQKPGVTIAGPVHGEEGQLKGIVGVDIEIAELSKFISELRVGKSGKAIIIHRNGDVIAYENLEELVIKSDDRSRLRLPKIDELSNPILQKSFDSMDWQYDEKKHLVLDEPKFASFQHKGNSYLTMFRPFPEEKLPWIIGVYIPENDYLGVIKVNQQFNFIVTVIITIVASVLGILLARKIIIPVIKLADGAKAIENFDIETPFEMETMFTEIQETADAFSRMKVSLKDYEKKLRDNEKVYRAITNTASDAIIMVDSNMLVTYVNPAAENMFGFTLNEFIGKKLNELLFQKHEKDSDLEGITLFMQDETEFLKDRTLKVTAIAKDGEEVPVELSLSKMKLGDDKHAVAILRNITERRKAGQLRKRLVNDLHDGIGGNLSNIKLLAEMSKAHNITEHTSKNLNAIAELSEDSITEIRNYMTILDDAELSWQSFSAELHQYCAKMLGLHDIEFSMKIEIKKGVPEPTTLLYMNIFKIVKEALNNIIKHSNANMVTLETLIKENNAQWIINDNGRVAEIPEDTGRGLLSMKSRVEELGGGIDFLKENGFTIIVNIPFTRNTVREQVLKNNV